MNLTLISFIPPTLCQHLFTTHTQNCEVMIYTGTTVVGIKHQCMNSFDG